MSLQFTTITIVSMDNDSRSAPTYSSVEASSEAEFPVEAAGHVALQEALRAAYDGDVPHDLTHAVHNTFEQLYGAVGAGPFALPTDSDDIEYMATFPEWEDFLNALVPNLEDVDENGIQEALQADLNAALEGLEDMDAISDAVSSSISSYSNA